jgi:capsular polysaccharide biosynthesis protein
MSGFGGELFALPASNADAVYGASHLATVAQTVADERASGAQWGYIDSIMFFGNIDNSSRQNWLAALASFHPNEMLELADSPGGNFLAKPIAAILGYHPGNSRLSDQFALIAGGEGQELHSNLTSLRVKRVARPKSFSDITIPEFERKGAVARSKTGHRPMPSPGDEWLHLENATVQDGGTVIVGDELVVYEVAADPSLDFVAGHFGSIRGSQANQDQVLVEKRPVAEQSIAEGILLAGRNDSNWYHWLIEYLPRVMQTPDVIADSVPVIVTSRTPQSGIDALRFFTDRPIVVVDASTAVSVGLLHVVAPTVQVLDTTRVEWSSGILLNPEPLRAMRTMLRTEVGEGDRRIFLQRSSRHRQMGNARKIEAVARKHGLEIVDPGNLTWDEQRSLFAEARLVVGASGAVMANYLFMPEGSRVLAMTSETLAGFVLPAAIAELAGVEFSYVLGKPSFGLDHFNHRRDWFHGNFEVKASEFDAALSHELLQLD